MKNTRTWKRLEFWLFEWDEGPATEVKIVYNPDGSIREWGIPDGAGVRSKGYYDVASGPIRKKLYALENMEQILGLSEGKCQDKS